MQSYTPEFLLWEVRGLSEVLGDFFCGSFERFASSASALLCLKQVRSKYNQAGENATTWWKTQLNHYCGPKREKLQLAIAVPL